MSDLIEFLRARLDEDERGAGDIHARDCENLNCGECNITFPCDCGQPARVLREVTAKRDIIARADSTLSHGHPDLARLAQGTLEALAFPYADHPDYRQEWGI